MFSSPAPVVNAPDSREDVDKVVMSTHTVCAVTCSIAKKAGGEEVLEVSQDSRADIEERWPLLNELV